jgi:hypothetical protein
MSQYSGPKKKILLLISSYLFISGPGESDHLTSSPTSVHPVINHLHEKLTTITTRGITTVHAPGLSSARVTTNPSTV